MVKVLTKHLQKAKPNQIWLDAVHDSKGLIFWHLVDNLVEAVVGLMDRALDLKPEVTGSNPGSDRKSTTAPRALHSRLPTAPSVYTWMG